MNHEASPNKGRNGAAQTPCQTKEPTGEMHRCGELQVELTQHNGPLPFLPLHFPAEATPAQTDHQMAVQTIYCHLHVMLYIVL